jgi:hypothetical protein
MVRPRRAILCLYVRVICLILCCVLAVPPYAFSNPLSVRPTEGETLLLSRPEFGSFAMSNIGKDDGRGWNNSIGKPLQADISKPNDLEMKASPEASPASIPTGQIDKGRLRSWSRNLSISRSNNDTSQERAKRSATAQRLHVTREVKTIIAPAVESVEASNNASQTEIGSASSANVIKHAGKTQALAATAPEISSLTRAQTDAVANVQKLSTEAAALHAAKSQNSLANELERNGEAVSSANYKAHKVDNLLTDEKAVEGSSLSAITSDRVENGANALTTDALSSIETNAAVASTSSSTTIANAFPLAAPLAPQTTPTAPTPPAVYNAVTDFSATRNQSGTWSYGYHTWPDGSFALLPNNNNVYGLEPGLSTWYLRDWWNIPAIIHNGTGVTKTYDSYIVHPPDMLNLRPSPNGENSVLRWTAPKGMTVKIEVTWAGLDKRGAATELMVNFPDGGTLSRTITIPHTRGNFVTTQKVKAGDVMDFAVSSDSDEQYDSTGLSVIITEAYSASGGFSATSNPSGTWSYGYRRTDGSFALMPSNAYVYGLPAGLSAWSTPNGGSNLPMIVRNGTGTAQTYFTYVEQPRDTINVHPGPNGEKGVVRWTAPSAMTIKIEGNFQGFDTRGATSDVSVVKNSTSPLYSSLVNGHGSYYQKRFAIRQDVQAGDVIDFVVGNGSNNSAADSIGVSVLISQLRQAGAHWQFNEGSGVTAVDATGNGNDGILKYVSRSIDRDGSGVLNFSGTGDVVSLDSGQLRSISNDFTISFWANPLSVHGIDAQVGTEGARGDAGMYGQRYVLAPFARSIAYDGGETNDAGAAISVGTNGISLYESNGGRYRPAVLVYETPISGWTHITVVYENRLPKLYVNGVLAKTGVSGLASVVHVGAASLGGHTDNFFHGQLDEVRIFNRPMTAAEVRSLATGIAEPVNAAPSVTISSPSSGAVATAPANIDLSANASDDGAISKVEFYANGSLIAAKAEQPFNATWGNVAAGTYSITAKATDDAGLTTTSGAVSITVNPKGGEVVLPPAGSRLITADVVALDQVFFYNRLGAFNPGGMIYALRRDVVPIDASKGLVPGNVQLRPDKRPRPIVLRMNAGDRLQIKFQNLLHPSRADDNQPATRTAGVHVIGMQLVNSILDDASNVGQNQNSLVAPGGTATYTFFAEREGNHLLYSSAAMTGGEGDGGSVSMGLFGSVNVEARGAEWYRSQLTAKELEYATTGKTAAGHPIINYDAVYPVGHPRAGTPIIKMLDNNQIVHTDLNAIITGPNKGRFPAGTYRANAVEPDREQPFREFTVIYHDEIKAVQAFPKFFEDPVLSHTLHSVRDSFAINYGTGGIGAEILANRLGVGPMANCTECKYEEFFLTSWAVGDPAQVVDVAANTVDANGNLIPGLKATKVLYPDDPSNVHHSYLNDHVKMRVVHAGPKEHHVHHLHAHQWLRTPDGDNSSYLDSQAMGPGYSFTTEIAYGGTGNRNKTPGDSIFHCHFYPHFAQGMWALWRAHDVFEAGTQLDANGRPAADARKLPDGEIALGTPIPAIVPLPTIAMAPMPTAQFKGYPFYIPGVAGHRPPHPPLDTVDDGGLPRHIITGGTAESHETRLDFNKELLVANARAIPELGTPEEIAAMNFHAQKQVATYRPDGTVASFMLNGLPAKPGAPFADPCRDDAGNAAGTRRLYKSANIQLDIKLNKAGWHFPQSRISVLWEDVTPTLNGIRPPEPLFFRTNTNDCIEFQHTNLVPHIYEQDDFQVRTPTDIMGQHIHLVKFDVTASDGAGNGFNYEDGTFAPGEVQERVHAINAAGGLRSFDGTTLTGLVLKAHPFFGAGPDANGDGIGDWMGAQTTVQRWFADDVLNNLGEDRTLRTVFTHDHFGPSTHQQAGLYAGLVVEPKGSTWKHNETGVQFGTRADGGPTSWQAVISTPNTENSYREFLLEFADFQLAYRPDGTPVNPPAKKEVGLPYLLETAPTCPGGAPRPCPEAVSADDPGTMSVNYRNEPVALRVRDPQTNTQVAGEAGDLSHVFRSNVTRADQVFNTQPNFYPSLNKDVQPGDPFTPLLRTYENDRVQIRILVGGFEEGHNFGVHGIKWKFEPDDPNSGWRNNQMMGISEHYEFIVPKLAKNAIGAQDYLYQPGTATDDLWNGLWGLMRAYNSRRDDLQPLPNNPNGYGPAITNPGDFNGVCPKMAPVRQFNVTAVTAQDALPEGTLVYNSRTGQGGKLHDPTAILYVRTSDLDVNGKLKAGVPVEPLILRANAGDCINVTLNNKLPGLVLDLDGFNTLPMIVEKFNNNQLSPSTDVGLHPQLLFQDVTRSNGANVGLNPVQTAKPGQSTTYQWYAGEMTVDPVTGAGVARPIEFGATNLVSSDPIKHPGKGAIGALIVEPQGSTWVEDVKARAQATVTKPDGTSFREFVLMFQNDINLRFGAKSNALGQPEAVPNMAEAEDAEDSGQNAFNYRTEPLWKRMGFEPDTSLEQTREFDYTNVLSNTQVGGDPVTPVFTATAGTPVRFRILMPGGHARNNVFQLHGHIWEEEPYTDASSKLGSNPLSEWKGAQFGIGPSSHFDLLLKNGAGGMFRVPGDYLYRTQHSFQFDGGLWGIFRVTPTGTQIRLDDTVWVEDAAPAGSTLGGEGEGWSWTGSSPAPFSEALAHQSAALGGRHQHFFYGATQTLTVGAGDTLFAYVYLDPASPPTEIMLQWNDGGGWEHRAYWGSNQIDWGVDGTISRRHMGALPPVGQWVRLEVPASLVGLEGRTLSGMAFTLFGGRATWDRAGKTP